jgi:excinuclease UvrABC helicase subunit UvrB
MENEETNRNLILLLKMFKNRPYHLAKYLIENSALTDDFINKIKNSDKFKEISDEKSEQKFLTPAPVYFFDISQMNNFYNSLTDDIKSLSKEKSIEKITKELNEKLNTCIKTEKYEDAARIRDYMSRNGIEKLK